jgi:hypothetical protein
MLQLSPYAGLNLPIKAFIVNILCQILSLKGKENFLQQEWYGTHRE